MGGGEGGGAVGWPFTSSAGVAPLVPEAVANALLTADVSIQRLPLPDTYSIMRASELPDAQPGSEMISETIGDTSGE